MAIYAAAYELGLNTLMLHYNLLYHQRFPWDPKAAGGRGIGDCLQRVEENLEVLNVELSKDTSLLHVIVKELGKLLALEKSRGVRLPAPGKKRMKAITRTWRKLVRLVRDTLHDCPRLFPWHRMGRAMAFCYLDLLRENDNRILPRLRLLVEAAASLPATRVKGDVDGAIIDFNRALEIDPEYTTAYVNRGIAKNAKGDHDGAIIDFNHALELDPKCIAAYCNRGIAKYAKGDFQGADADYSRARQLDPEKAVASVSDDTGARDSADLNQAPKVSSKERPAHFNRVVKHAKGYRHGTIAAEEPTPRLDSEAAVACNGGIAKRANAMPVIDRLMRCENTTDFADPCALLNHVLQEPRTLLDNTAPAAAVMPKLARLDETIKQVLAATPDGSILELSDDLSQPIAMLRGVPYPISDNQRGILRQLVDAEDAFVKAEGMAIKDPMLRAANIKREVDDLPKAIRAHIKSKKGWWGGFRWTESAVAAR